MGQQALGLIETIGMVAAIESIDICLKSANVKLLGYEIVNGEGLVNIKIQGDIGAVKASIDAAKASLSKENKIFATLVIPRPDDKISSMIRSDATIGLIKEKKSQGALQNTDTSNEKNEESVKEELDKEVEELQENEDICNICHDPKCQRKKGQPRNMCIHYKNKKLNFEGDNVDEK